MRFIGWLFAAVLLILLGWAGGPVAMASYRVATSDTPDLARARIARGLDEAYERALAVEQPLSSMGFDENSVRACGYDPQTILHEENLPFRLSTDWGMILLNNRAGAERERVESGFRVAHYAGSYWPATIAALTTCLDTPLASICQRRIETMAEAAKRANAKELAEARDFSRKQDLRIKCTFLDGAAARRGIAKIAPAPKPAP